jgi:hypothetical protein
VLDLCPSEEEEKKKRKKKKKDAWSFWSRESWRKLGPKTEREEKKIEFSHLAISVKDWRVIYGPILIKFQHVVPYD